MIKLIFFVTAPFCKRDYERYGVDVFIQNGFDVYIWDLTFVLYPELEGKIVPPDPILWDKSIIFRSTVSVINALNNCSEQTIILNTTVAIAFKTLKIYKLISKKKISYMLTPASASVPPLYSVKTCKAKIKKICKIFNVNKLLNYILRHIPIYLLKINPASFVIAEGLNSSISRPGVTTKTKIIRTHALDYDIYLKLGNNIIESQKGNKRIAVFLDGYLPFHPDYFFTQETPIVSAEVYYPELCGFFDVIEKKYNLTVVIAAHPRSKYEEMPNNFFGGRSIIKGRTAELIQNSKLVMSQGSTAISFAVLYKIPALFLMTNEIWRNNGYDYRKYIMDFAFCLGSQLINISKNFDDVVINFDINEIRYREYLNNYIKVDGSDNLLHWQIVCNAIKAYWDDPAHQEVK